MIVIKNFIAKLLSYEKSPSKLTFACCLGIFIATSPFLGLQTWIALPLAWALGLNALVVIAVLYLVNNPLTMIPIVVADYAVGHWVIERWLDINLQAYNPSWMGWINTKIGPTLYQWLGVTEICFWCYLVGGTLFAALCTTLAYPFLRWFFARRS